MQGKGISFSSYWLVQNETCGNMRKRCFMCLHVTLNSFSASWPSQNATWLRLWNQCFWNSNRTCNLFSVSGQPKMRLWLIKKKTLLVVVRHCELFFCHLTSPKCRLDEVDKRWFKLSNGTLKSSSASSPTENSTFIKLIKRRFKWSNGI